MDNEEILKILDEHIAKLECASVDCGDNILPIIQAKDIISSVKISLQSILPRESRAFRKFDQKSRDLAEWWTETSTGYVDIGNCSYLTKWIEIVKSVANELEPEFLRSSAGAKNQLYFSAGDKYQAMRNLLHLMRLAKNDLAIVDTFMDESIFDYIGSLDQEISVKLLTGSRIRMFPKLYVEYRNTNRNVEAKENEHCHDRFIVIDNNETWHLGASINHAGKKAFMVNKVNNEEEKSRFLKDLSSWWEYGKPFT